MSASGRLESGAFRRADPRLLLLVGQSLSLGVLLSLLIICASALFLTRFGSQALPTVYISVALLGSLVFYGYGELQRRFPLPALSLATLGAVALFFLLTWLGLLLSDAGWIVFILMVSFSVIIQLGFVLLGNQAGRLFDVREMKGKFPRVVAGFAVGFLLGGFIASLLAGVIGRTENLLLPALMASLSMLAFLFAADRRYHERLVHAGAGGGRGPGKPLWQLLAKRFVLLIVLYQMLSAMVSQLLDFMLFDQAAARYSDSLGLAAFLGNYTVALNLTDILFLALFAGLLLSRYGLRFGMLANPAVDLVLLLVTIGVGLASGVESAPFFLLVASMRIGDITLTDGTTRGSINTAYQALPAQERVAVQTGVEGIGVPLALGLTGVVLLLFGAIPGLGILHIMAFTLAVTVLWCAAALLVYRGYARALIGTLRRRALDPASLSLDDASSRAVVLGLQRSNRLPEVRLALDMLEQASDEMSVIGGDWDAAAALDAGLIALAENPQPAIQVEALGRIERRRPAGALPVVTQCLQAEAEVDGQASAVRAAALRAAALRAFCALEGSAGVEQTRPYLEKGERAVRRAAAVGLLRYGGIPGVLAAGESVSALARSPEPADRALAAEIIGGVAASAYYEPLLSLLADEDRDVRRAALFAAAEVRHPRLLPLVVENLDRPGVRSAALEAAIAGGEALLPYVARALEDSGSTVGGRATRLARACGRIGGKRSVELLSGALAHPDGEVRGAALAALCALDYQVGRADVAATARIEGLVQDELRAAARLLAAGREVGEGPETEPLRRALRDEVGNVRGRIFHLLALMYDRRATLRAGERLREGSGGAVDGAASAAALETLEVMLAGELKRPLMTLVDPRLTDDEKARQLGDQFAVLMIGRSARLAEFITDEAGDRPHLWLRSCAAHAAGRLQLRELAGPVEAALATDYLPLRQSAAWALSVLAPERLAARRAEFAGDPDPLTARPATDPPHSPAAGPQFPVE